MAKRERMRRGRLRPDVIIGLLIFVTCLFVYLANGQTISSNDNVPNTLLGFHWLDRQSLNFDAFRDSLFYRDQPSGVGPPYYWSEAPNGHLSSTYPIGVAILTFPLYGLFYCYLQVAGWLGGMAPAEILSLANPEYRATIVFFEKLAAAIVASGSMVIFYNLLRCKFERAIAILTTFIFAFATTTWMISSQALWQHGSANLVVLSILLGLFKANRATEPQRKVLLLVVGFFCGLLPGIRPTSSVYGVAAIVYAILAYRREAVYLLLGLPSFLLSASWNVYYFGLSLKSLIVAGYNSMSAEEASFAESFYRLTAKQFTEGFLGLLVSPARGLFVYSPILLFALPGSGAIAQPLKRSLKRFLQQSLKQSLQQSPKESLQQFWTPRLPAKPSIRRDWKSDEILVLGFLLAALVLFLQYCFFTIWPGGPSYGPRYMTDLLPVLGLLMAYSLRGWVAIAPTIKPIWRRVIPGVFGLCLCFSLFTQIIGAFSTPTNWDGIPYPAAERFWQWRDTPIERRAQNLFYGVLNPMGDSETYAAGLEGEVLGLEDGAGQPIVAPYPVKPLDRVPFQAELLNRGRSPWYGYKTGMERGVAVVRVQFFDAQGEESRVSVGFLYLTDFCAPGERGRAIGVIRFPKEPGTYQMVLSFSVRGQGLLKRLKPQLTQVVEVQVIPA
ncbi:MAG: hypothetical protein MUF49_16905 [Oculatellaceae cyanobacterium Prado106]|jgi:hypothetical protein|nr:hypothetical protein [Oculatellaceae cyanobacterium Prado106]